MVARDGATQTFTYDVFGHLNARTDPANRRTTYEYDRTGRLLRNVDRTGQAFSFAYDKDGNLTTVTHPDGDVVRKESDPVGRPTSISDADTIVERTYNDADDLLTERTRGQNGVALPDVTLSYTYDANGNPTALNGPGGEVRYTWDNRARLTALHDPAGRAFSMTYDGADRLTGLTRPNGVHDTLSYTGGTLKSRIASQAGDIIGRAEYTLDALRRRTAMSDLDGTHVFTHDDANRLTRADHPEPSGVPDEVFEYDRVGNRTAWEGSPPDSVEYDAGMQLLSDGTYDYTYDEEGRLTERRNRSSGAVTRYQWSSAGKLTSITAPGGAVSSYRYDALGRRVEVNESGTVRRFTYSGSNLHNEFDAANTLHATYVTGVFPDTVYEIVREGTAYYPLLDGIGSVTALTNSTGSVVGRVRYSAFGRPHVSGASDDGFTFTGHQYDSATGLVYARNRYYDPTVGRFISQDPLLAINPYSYCINAPLEYTDPSGRQATSENITVRCNKLWSKAAKEAVKRKLRAYAAAAAKGKLKITRNTRTPECKKGQAAFSKANGLVGTGLDADHIIELILGGLCDAMFTNLHALDGSANRSIGSQIGNQARNLKEGTKITIVPKDCG